MCSYSSACGRGAGLEASASARISFKPSARVVAVDLLDVELAHELDRVGLDHLARHHDREAGRVRNHEVRRHERRPLLDAPVDLGALEREVLAPFLAVGHVERGAHVALERRAGRIVAEPVVEAAEVRQVGHVLHQRLDPRWRTPRAPPRRPPSASSSIFLEISTSTRSRFATSLRVLLMLVCSSTELREVLLSWISYSVGQDALELRAVVARRAADEREARRVEHELVLPERRQAPAPR